MTELTAFIISRILLSKVSLAWHGAGGSDGSVKYIYNVNYEMPILTGIIRKLESDGVVYQINPAFAPGLQLQVELRGNCFISLRLIHHGNITGDTQRLGV